MRLTSAPCAFLLVLVLVAGLALSPAAYPRPPIGKEAPGYDPSVANPPRSAPDAQQQCRLLGYVFYRLAERRDAGSGASSATAAVERWVLDWIGTGTHLKVDYKDLVGSSSAFVFKQAVLTPSALGHFAFNSCQIDAEFASDEPRRSASTVLLMKSVTACQAKFPKPLENEEIGACIRSGREASEQQVKY